MHFKGKQLDMFEKIHVDALPQEKKIWFEKNFSIEPLLHILSDQNLENKLPEIKEIKNEKSPRKSPKRKSTKNPS